MAPEDGEGNRRQGRPIPPEGSMERIFYDQIHAAVDPLLERLKAAQQGAADTQQAANESYVAVQQIQEEVKAALFNNISILPNLSIVVLTIRLMLFSSVTSTGMAKISFPLLLILFSNTFVLMISAATTLHPWS